jgi:hypothetical protein
MRKKLFYLSMFIVLVVGLYFVSSPERLIDVLFKSSHFIYTVTTGKCDKLEREFVIESYSPEADGTESEKESFLKKWVAAEEQCPNQFLNRVKNGLAEIEGRREKAKKEWPDLKKKQFQDPATKDLECWGPIHDQIWSAIETNNFSEKKISAYIHARYCGDYSSYWRNSETKAAVKISQGIVLFGRYDDYILTKTYVYKIRTASLDNTRVRGNNGSGDVTISGKVIGDPNINGAKLSDLKDSGSYTEVFPDRVYRLKVLKEGSYNNITEASNLFNLKSMPTDIFNEYFAARQKLGKDTARDINNRAHRLYQKGDYKGASEVVSYALHLDPDYNLGWYNAAAYAAKDNDVYTAVEYLRHYKLSGKTLLNKIRKDPDFKPLLESNADFRQYVYQVAAENEHASEFNRSFNLEADYSRSIGCGPEDSCESYKVLYIDYYLVSPKLGDDWKVPLIIAEEQGEYDPQFQLVDIEKRLFIAVQGEVFEVNLKKKDKTKISNGDRIMDSVDKFPLIISSEFAEKDHYSWFVKLYDGKNSPKDVGCFKPKNKFNMADAFYTIKQIGKNYFALDSVSAKEYLLIPSKDCGAAGGT